MAAPTEEVFEMVNTLRNWEAWSPWAKRDPNMKQTYSGPASGRGAEFAWAGNKDVGEGRMAIVESRPCELIRLRLEFLKPFKAVNTTEFVFSAENAGTRLRWRMIGKNNFVGKFVGLLMNMDKMIGTDFEAGLAAMRQIVESNNELENLQR
jgi:hypothetical protein